MDWTYYIFYGTANGFQSMTSADANITFNGTSPSYFAGRLALADLNYDGYKDLIVGAYGKNLSGGAVDWVGQVNIFYRSSGTFRSYTAAEANVTINGTSPGFFGHNILVQDLNNDGYPDLIISAPYQNLSGEIMIAEGKCTYFIAVLMVSMLLLLHRQILRLTALLQAFSEKASLRKI